MKKYLSSDLQWDRCDYNESQVKYAGERVEKIISWGKLVSYEKITLQESKYWGKNNYTI